MRIIVTGATGSLGAFFTRWFSGNGYEVMAVGRTANPPAQLLDCAEYIQADITQPFNLSEADVCIHCAGLADDKAKFSDLFKANVDGTRHVVEAAKACKTFIHISSSSVYSHSNKLLTEEMAGEALGEKLSQYGKSKLLSEVTVAHLAKNKSCFVLRPRAIYGAGDKVLLPRLLKLVRNNSLIKPGDMNVELSLTHFYNLTQAVEKCIQSNKRGFHIYNVSDDKVYILNDVIKKLLSAMYAGTLPERKVPLLLLRCMSTFGIGDVTPLLLNTVSKNLVLDISKIKRELNYAPTMNLELSLNEIESWVKTIGGTEILKEATPALAWKF